MTFDEEVKDFKVYTGILALWGFPYPVKETRRASLDKLMEKEYARIQKGKSLLSAAQRRVVCRIADMSGYADQTKKEVIH